MNDYDTLLVSVLKKDMVTRLQSIPESDEIDYVFSRRFENSVNDIFDSLNENARKKRSIPLLLRQAAVLAVCFISLALAVIMINPKVRAGFVNAVVEFFEEHIKFSFNASKIEAYDFEKIEEVNAQYIPNGFSLLKTEGIFEAKNYIYENETGVTFTISVSYNDGLSVLTDKQKSEFEKIKIQEKEAFLVYSKNGDNYGTVIIPGAKITVTIFGYLEKTELIKIAEGII